MTEIEAKVIKGKLQGKKSKEIAQDAYPNQTPEAGGVSVRRVLQRATVKEELAKALKRHNITIDKILAPISKGLEAKTKHQIGQVQTDNGDGSESIEYMYEYEDNIPLQLSASDRAVKLMGLDKAQEPDPPKNTPIDNEALQKAIEAGDMVTLQQIVFSKGS